MLYPASLHAIVPRKRASYCTRLISLLRLYGKPYGVNYIARYSLCKGIGSTFTENVVCAVHIRADLASIFGAIQTVSATYALTAKDVLFLIVGFVVGEGIKVKKAGLTGIALFPDFYLDTHECSLVRDHLDEPCMRNGNEILIVALPHATFLLPEGVLADNDRPNPVFYQEVNHTPTHRMQIVINLPVAFVGDAFHLPGHPLSIPLGQLLFEFLHTLVVPLVPRLYWTTVNQSRCKALPV